MNNLMQSIYAKDRRHSDSIDKETYRKNKKSLTQKFLNSGGQLNSDQVEEVREQINVNTLQMPGTGNLDYRRASEPPSIKLWERFKEVTNPISSMVHSRVSTSKSSLSSDLRSKSSYHSKAQSKRSSNEKISNLDGATNNSYSSNLISPITSNSSSRRSSSHRIRDSSVPRLENLVNNQRTTKNNQNQINNYQNLPIIQIRNSENSDNQIPKDCIPSSSSGLYSEKSTNHNITGNLHHKSNAIITGNGLDDQIQTNSQNNNYQPQNTSSAMNVDESLWPGKLASETKSKMFCGIQQLIAKKIINNHPGTNPSSPKTDSPTGPLPIQTAAVLPRFQRDSPSPVASPSPAVEASAEQMLFRTGTDAIIAQSKPKIVQQNTIELAGPKKENTNLLQVNNNNNNSGDSFEGQNKHQLETQKTITPSNVNSKCNSLHSNDSKDDTKFNNNQSNSNLNQSIFTSVITYDPNTIKEVKRELPPSVLDEIVIKQQSLDEVRSDLIGLCERMENALAGGNWQTLKNIHSPKMTAYLPHIPISLISFDEEDCYSTSICDLIEKSYKLDRSGKFGILKARSIVMPPFSTKILNLGSAVVTYRRFRQEIMQTTIPVEGMEHSFSGNNSVKTQRSEVTRIFTRGVETNFKWKCVHWHETWLTDQERNNDGQKKLIPLIH